MHVYTAGVVCRCVDRHVSAYVRIHIIYINLCNTRMQLRIDLLTYLNSFLFVHVYYDMHIYALTWFPLIRMHFNTRCYFMYCHSMYDWLQIYMEVVTFFTHPEGRTMASGNGWQLGSPLSLAVGQPANRVETATTFTCGTKVLLNGVPGMTTKTRRHVSFVNVPLRCLITVSEQCRLSNVDCLQPLTTRTRTKRVVKCKLTKYAMDYLSVLWSTPHMQCSIGFWIVIWSNSSRTGQLMHVCTCACVQMCMFDVLSCVVILNNRSKHCMSYDVGQLISISNIMPRWLGNVNQCNWN